MTFQSNGLIEFQTNGGWGHDFTTDPDSIWAVGERLPATGVTAFVPTIITAPYEVADRAIDTVKAGPPPGYRGARVLGLHIEGPWLSPDQNGAHPESLLRQPDTEVARRWADSSAVVVVTIAPELPGAFEAASVLDEAGVVVSAGHSDASFEIAAEALEGPFSVVTHLFNQMSSFGHREPGLAGAALTSNAACGLIVDGIHSHAAAVRLAWDMLGPERLFLITDAMAAAGLGPGRYVLGDTGVIVGSDGPRTPDGRLAGSVLTLDRALFNLMTMAGCPFDEAIQTVTSTPGSVLGVDSTLDSVQFDENLQVLETRIEDEVVYRLEE